MLTNYRTRAAVLSSAFLIAHLLLPYNPFTYVWGLDSLLYHPAWMQFLFAAVALLLLSARVRRVVLSAFSSAGAGRLVGDRRIRFLVLLVAGVLSFVNWSSAAHLLGDGYLQLRELPLAVAGSFDRIGHEPLSFWIISRLYLLLASLDDPGLITLRVYSWLSGSLYLALVFFLTGMLGLNRPARAALMGLLLTAGFMQLFFGYVETYPILLPGMLLYLVCGLKSLRGELPLWVAAVPLGFLMPLHFTVVALSPSLLILAILSWRRGVSRPSLLLSLILPPVLSLLVLSGLGVNLWQYATGLRGSHFLPLSGELSSIELYHLFSPAHFADVANELLLTAPGAVLVFALLHRRAFSGHPEFLFLQSAALFPLFFIFAANPEIGAFRDWDVLAFPALPLTLWAGLALARHFRDAGELSHVGLAVCLAAGLHTAAWIGLNADPVTAEKRFVRLLEECSLSPNALSYGWETLGIYRRGEDDSEGAMRAYQKAVDATPDHPRHWGTIGHLARETGQLQEALSAYQTSLTLDVNQAAVWSKLGLVHVRLEEYDRAIPAYHRALELRPADAITWHNLGDALSHSDRHREAVAAFQAALHYKPDLVPAHLNLGIAYERSGDSAGAETAYRRLVALVPDHLAAYNQLGNLLWDRGDRDAAVAVFEQSLEVDSTFAMGHYNLALLYREMKEMDQWRRHGRRFLELETENSVDARRIRSLLEAR